MWRTSLSSSFVSLRFILSNNPSHTPVLRKWILKNHPLMKAVNPRMGIHVREGEHIGEKPYIIAQYDWGVEETIDLSSADTPSKINDMIKAAAQRVPDPSEVNRVWKNTKNVEGWMPSGERDFGLPSACMDGARERDISTL